MASRDTESGYQVRESHSAIRKPAFCNESPPKPNFLTGNFVTKVAGSPPNTLGETLFGSEPIARSHAVTGEMPQTVLVMISDEAGAGRIVVELDAFVRLNIDIDRQLDALEARVLAELPQLAGRRSRPRSGSQAD
jgi:hypothetical protein